MYVIFFNINLSQTKPHLRIREVVVSLPQKQIERKRKQGRNQNKSKKSDGRFLFDSSHIIADQCCINLTHTHTHTHTHTVAH